MSSARERACRDELEKIAMSKSALSGKGTELLTLRGLLRRGAKPETAMTHAFQVRRGYELMKRKQRRYGSGTGISERMLGSGATTRTYTGGGEKGFMRTLRQKFPKKDPRILVDSPLASD
jgi:hypothetical protein